MKKFLNILGAAALSALTLTSCSDATSIGSSLLETQSNVVIKDGFKLTGKSVEVEQIQSRTILQLLGSIDAKEYGRLTSDYVTQFMPVARLDTIIKDISDIDSCKLLMMFNAGQFVGDSVIPMGLDVYELTGGLTAPIFSNTPVPDYNPTPLASRIYGASNLSAATDSIGELSYREIYVKLPFRIAEKLWNIYQENPNDYLTPTAFAAKFPGLYIKNSYGAGRVTKIGATAIQFYYHHDDVTDEGNDTIYKYVGNFYQATPEIISNNLLRLEVADQVKEAVNNGEYMLVAPAGYDVEIEFPIKEVIDYYLENRGNQSVINSLSMSIPVESISNTYGIEPPSQLLMILKNKKKEFFEKSMLTDGLTSFYATFSSTTGTYSFSSLRDYLVDALSRKDELTADDYTFVLTPVYIQTESTSSSYYYSGTTLVKTITPYIEDPAMAKLMLDDATISLTFTNQDN